MLSRSLKIFGDKACHPERSGGSGEPAAQILSAAKDDMQDTARGRSREIFSPNIYAHLRTSGMMEEFASSSLPELAFVSEQSLISEPMPPYSLQPHEHLLGLLISGC